MLKTIDRNNIDENMIVSRYMIIKYRHSLKRRQTNTHYNFAKHQTGL